MEKIISYSLYEKVMEDIAINHTALLNDFYYVINCTDRNINKLLYEVK